MEFIKIKQICPKCNGRRMVFNPFGLFLTIGLPMALLLEQDAEEECCTKKKCPTCKGRGFLEF